MRSVVLALAALTALALPADAQLGKITEGLQKAKEVKDKVDDLVFTDAEEQELGAKVSGMLREKYGVVQDKAVHKYVALVGTALAQSSSRPSLHWTFIVLDTDGVNAFAAPGGFVHITRGALALAQNEAELADVLGHEISHITGKHTIKAIQKGKLVQAGADSTRNALLGAFADKAYEMVLENAFDRGEEMDADKNGVALANTVGYAPTGLGAFLTRLADRNKDLKDRSGLFASHPDTKARLDGLAKVITSDKLAATATVAPRFHQAILYKPVPVSQIATAISGSAGLTGGKDDGKGNGKGDNKSDKAEPKAADPKPAGGKFGLSGLNPLGKEKASNQTVSSAGSRGVNPDRDATGGANSALVVVTLTAAEIADFRKGIV